MEAEQRVEERMSGGDSFVSAVIGCGVLYVIGIMGWFSGGSDAFDGVQNETGAKFTSVCFFGKFKTHICIRSVLVQMKTVELWDAVP